MRAFVAEKGEDGVTRGLRDLEIGDPGEGDVLVKVAWSSVNYKDALATIAKGQVARISPLIPGIDLAGTDEDSGEEVLAHGYDLGVAHHGGYAEYARVRSEWIVPLPSGLSARQAMAIGTAGYTAARCVIALETAGVRPGSGPVLVTGASGGVGSTAVDILAARGYEVVASSGKDPEFLKALGASEVISREDAAGDAARPLEKTRWAGAVDCVGGEVLAGVLRSVHYGGVRRGLRQHRRPQAAHDRPPVHPARRLAARGRFGADADRGAQGDLGAARGRSAAAAPRRLDRARDRPRRARGRAHRDPARRALGADDREGRLGRFGAAFEPRHELVEAQFLEPLADGLELGGAELDERAALTTEVQRLAQPRLTGIQPGDDRLEAPARGFVRQLFFDGHRFRG